MLQRFGLSPGLIAKIKVLYKDIESVLKINGGLCKPFKVTRGIRQGCSMSFIDGLFLSESNTHLNLSAYADDISVIVRNQEDVKVLENIVENISCQS